MDKTREELTQSRDEMVRRLDAIRADIRNGLDADSKEQAIQLENLDVLREISRITEEELRKINLQLSALPK